MDGWMDGNDEHDETMTYLRYDTMCSPAEQLSGTCSMFHIVYPVIISIL